MQSCFWFALSVILLLKYLFVLNGQEIRNLGITWRGTKATAGHKKCKRNGDKYYIDHDIWDIRKPT